MGAEQKQHHLSRVVDTEAHVLPVETYVARLRNQDRRHFGDVIFPLLDDGLPDFVRLFVIGSSWKKPNYRDIDIVIGAPHEDVPEVASRCHELLSAHPRVTIQETTQTKDPGFVSPLPIGFGVTVDYPHKIRTKAGARGMFDFAVPRYGLWQVLYTNNRGIMIR